MTVRRAAAVGDCEGAARVMAQAMVASSAYLECVDERAEYLRLFPRVLGYVSGEYSPSFTLSERAMFVALSSDEVVGMTAGHRTTRFGMDGELQWSFVLPEHQRQGVGGELLVQLRGWFRSVGIKSVIVDAPPSNPFRKFYEKHGAEAYDEHWLYWPDIDA